MTNTVLWVVIGLGFIAGVNYLLLFSNREDKDK